MVVPPEEEKTGHNHQFFNHGLPVYPNLIKGIQLSDLNQLWVADITYIRILTFFVYLAVILDAFSRKAIQGMPYQDISIRGLP